VKRVGWYKRVLLEVLDAIPVEFDLTSFSSSTKVEDFILWRGWEGFKVKNVDNSFFF
jgi:hypothetical protein